MVRVDNQTVAFRIGCGEPVMRVAPLDAAWVCPGRFEDRTGSVDVINDEVDGTGARFSWLQDDVGAASKFEDGSPAHVCDEPHTDLGIELGHTGDISCWETDVPDPESGPWVVGWVFDRSRVGLTNWHVR